MNEEAALPVENNRHYVEWLEANRRLLKATQILGAMKHLPENAPELMTVKSEWHAARSAYQAVCAKMLREQ